MQTLISCACFAFSAGQPKPVPIAPTGSPNLRRATNRDAIMQNDQLSPQRCRMSGSQSTAYNIGRFRHSDIAPPSLSFLQVLDSGQADWRKGCGVCKLRHPRRVARFGLAVPVTWITVVGSIFYRFGGPSPTTVIGHPRATPRDNSSQSAGAEKQGLEPHPDIIKSLSRSL